MNPQFAEQPAPHSESLPDKTTSECILYGSTFPWLNSAMWTWDEIEAYLLDKAEQLDGQIMDREFAYHVVCTNKHLIFARTPPVNNVTRLKDLMTMKELVKVIAALKKLNTYRKMNQTWSRKKGIEEYVKQMVGRGITEDEWKAATATYNMHPIDYDSVHGVPLDELPGEVYDWGEAMEDLMGIEVYNKLCEKMVRGEPVPEFMDPDFDHVIEEEYEEEESDETEDEEEVEPVEEEPETVTIDPAWSEVLETMFPDPVAEALSCFEPSYDDICSRMSEWISLSDSIGRETIDEIISYAKELTA